jgi:hypothetical protein
LLKQRKQYRPPGLCPFTWLSVNSKCNHFCWHPDGHPGCHNCELCGTSVNRQTWEHLVGNDGWCTCGEFHEAKRQPYTKIEARPDPLPKPKPQPLPKARPEPKPEPLPKAAADKKPILKKRDLGPCLYMFFSMSVGDYAPHAHECRKPAGHQEQHVCCRCGHRVNVVWGEPYTEPKTEGPKTWHQQRKYYSQQKMRPQRMFGIDDRVLKAVDRELLDTAPKRELAPGLKKKNAPFKDAARYRAFVHRRRWAGAMASALIGLNILVLNSED